MIIDNLMLIPGLVGGGITSLVFGVLVAMSYVFAREIWTADISQGAQPVPEASKGKAVAWTLTIILCMLVGSTATAWWVATKGHGFWEATLAAYWVQIVINVLDLIVIDIIVYQWIKPKVMEIPGVPPLEGTWPHVIDAAKGLIFGLVFALVASAISLLA